MSQTTFVPRVVYGSATPDTDTDFVAEAMDPNASPVNLYMWQVDRMLRALEGTHGTTHLYDVIPSLSPAQAKTIIAQSFFTLPVQDVPQGLFEVLRNRLHTWVKEGGCMRDVATCNRICRSAGFKNPDLRDTIDQQNAERELAQKQEARQQQKLVEVSTTPRQQLVEVHTPAPQQQGVAAQMAQPKMEVHTTPQHSSMAPLVPQQQASGQHVPSSPMPLPQNQQHSLQQQSTPQRSQYLINPQTPQRSQVQAHGQQNLVEQQSYVPQHVPSYQVLGGHPQAQYQVPQQQQQQYMPQQAQTQQMPLQQDVHHRGGQAQAYQLTAVQQQVPEQQVSQQYLTPQQAQPGLTGQSSATSTYGQPGPLQQTPGRVLPPQFTSDTLSNTMGGLQLGSGANQTHQASPPATRSSASAGPHSITPRQASPKVKSTNHAGIYANLPTAPLYTATVLPQSYSQMPHQPLYAQQQQQQSPVSGSYNRNDGNYNSQLDHSSYISNYSQQLRPLQTASPPSAGARQVSNGSAPARAQVHYNLAPGHSSVACDTQPAFAPATPAHVAIADSIIADATTALNRYAKKL